MLYPAELWAQFEICAAGYTTSLRVRRVLLRDDEVGRLSGPRRYVKQKSSGLIVRPVFRGVSYGDF